MAGIVDRMFPGWEDTKNAYAPLAKSIGRGIQTAPSGLLDLASLPFTLSGLVDPESVPGSTAWMDKRGFNIPKQKSESGFEQFLLDFSELGAGMVLPSKLGGALGSKANDLLPSTAGPAKAAPLTEIPSTRGQKANDIKMMSDAAKLGNDPNFAQRVSDFKVLQNDTGGKIIDGFRRSLAKAAPNKPELGRKIQKTFDDFLTGMNKKVSKMNSDNYDKALKSTASKKPFMMPVEADFVIDSFIKDATATGLNKEQVAALEQLKKDWYGSTGGREVIRANTGEGTFDTFRLRPKADTLPDKTTVFGIDSNIKNINEKYRQKQGGNSPYDAVDSHFLDRVRTTVRSAYDTALEATAGGDDKALAESASALRDAISAASTNAQKMGQLKEQMLMRVLGNKDDEMLNLESLVDKFGKLTQTERTFFEEVAKKHAPELVDNVRRKLFDDLVDAGTNVGRSSGESSFDLQRFLGANDALQTKNPELYNWILGKDPKVKARFDNIITQARTAINSGSPVGEVMPNPGDTARRVGSAAFGAATGKIGAARVADSTFSVIQNLATDKEALYKHLFEGGPVPPSAGTVIMDKAKKGLMTVVNKSPFDAGGAETGRQVGAASEMAERLNQGEVQDRQQPPMPQGVSEMAPEDTEMIADPADLNWLDESHVEPSMQADPADLNWLD